MFPLSSSSFCCCIDSSVFSEKWCSELKLSSPSTVCVGWELDCQSQFGPPVTIEDVHVPKERDAQHRVKPTHLLWIIVATVDFWFCGCWGRCTKAAWEVLFPKSSLCCFMRSMKDRSSVHCGVLFSCFVSFSCTFCVSLSMQQSYEHKILLVHLKNENRMWCHLINESRSENKPRGQVDTCYF